jgi:transposase InsO family protein
MHVEILPNKRSEVVFEALQRGWIAHYGPPRLIICDQGREFLGEPFASKVNQLGILLHFTDVRSPWQNARTERAGGAFKSSPP